MEEGARFGRLTSLSARWWDDSVVPQIHDHLSVVVETMSHDQRGQPQARHFVLSPRAVDRFDLVLVVDRGDRLVHVSERFFQELHDFRLGFHRRGTGFVVSDLNWGFHLQNGGPDFEIGGRHMLDLLSDSRSTLLIARSRAWVTVRGGSGFGICWANALQQQSATRIPQQGIIVFMGRSYSTFLISHD